ncbi:hypothetical protein JTE90_003298 [Oedothorax gibbosus]|uniref:DUF4773 domain-containing protein n=1 Tax=Oedothorax gibbosus TaxID=931172 RepID=A0AAV6V5W1_9ARAC|nr:hypothetical protein JTE90_003298 [Oedothorax gibbosus]
MKLEITVAFILLSLCAFAEARFTTRNKPSFLTIPVDDVANGNNGLLPTGLEQPLPFNCDCEGLTCKCCGTVSVTEEITTDACISFTYHGERTELHTTITLNDLVVFDEPIITANDPPAICVSYPGWNLAADLCFDFYDLQVFEDSLHVCLRVIPRVLMQPITHIEIGCYTLKE